MGRFYAYSSDDIVPIIQLPRLVRSICMSRKLSIFTREAAVTEIDQCACHVTIMHHLLCLLEPTNVQQFDWVREIVDDSETVRNSVAEHYEIDCFALTVREMMERFTTVDGSQLLTLDHVTAYVTSHPPAQTRVPCTAKIAKRILNGVIYGQGLAAVLSENNIIIKNGTTHHPLVVNLSKVVRTLPKRLSTIDDQLSAKFNVSWEMCMHVAHGADNIEVSALSLLCQTIETCITETMLKFATSTGLSVVVYAYDGIFVETARSTQIMPLQLTAMAYCIFATHGVAMRIASKIDPVLSPGSGPLALPAPDKFSRDIHEMCVIRTTLDHEYSRQFVNGVYELAFHSGIRHLDCSTPTSQMLVNSLSMYVSKFFVHNSAMCGMFLNISYDPVIPDDIVDTTFMSSKHLGMQAVVTFRNLLVNEDMSWLQVLSLYIPRKCNFSHQPSAKNYNIVPLLRDYDEPPKALEHFVFSMRRECKVLRDNYTKPDRSYPQAGDNNNHLFLFLYLEYVLCGFDIEAFVFLHRVTAARFLHLHEKIPIIIQCSSAIQGIGKNTFFEKLLGRTMLGDALNRARASAGMYNGLTPGEPCLSYLVSQTSMVGSRFNGFEAGLNLVIYDECARISDKGAQNQFKAKATNDLICVEEKFKEITQKINMALSVFMSNYNVSLMVEKGCRRNFLIRVADFYPRMSMEDTVALHKAIDTPESVWMFYRHLITCNDIPTSLDELQRDIPLTDHKVMMMALSDDLVSGVVATLATHPSIKEIMKTSKEPIFISKRLVLEALRVSSPSTNVLWATVVSKLQSVKVSGLRRAFSVWDIEQHFEKSTVFEQIPICQCKQEAIFGMEFTDALMEYVETQEAVRNSSRCPKTMSAANEQFIVAALPLLRKSFTFDLEALQVEASAYFAR